MRNSAAFLVALGLAWSAGASGALADGSHHGEDRDHDVARELYEHGAIRSLHDILATVAAQVTGDVVAVDLVERGERWVYEVQVVTSAGQRVMIAVDAATATALDTAGSTP
jgi:uncharacterized membrane protein YkoI